MFDIFVGIEKNLDEIIDFILELGKNLVYILYFDGEDLHEVDVFGGGFELVEAKSEICFEELFKGFPFL